MKVFSLKMKKQPKRRIILIIVSLIILICIIVALLQRYGAHREAYFVPDYPKVTLTEESGYETFFLQTGLGPSAVDRLLEAGDFQGILDAQEAFFRPRKVECRPLLGWFTRVDQLAGDSDGEDAIDWVDSIDRETVEGTKLVDLQPGDIIVTLSTHSLGWNHGHAGLIINDDTTLECVVLGTDSMLADVEKWCNYSNYAVLRVKDTTPELRQEVADYGVDTLQGIPYSLLAGFIGDKAPEPDSLMFGLHCSYLVWYAWNHFGYDLDSDGGRLASTYDVLHSDQIEVVQLYGLDPRDFLQ